MTSKPKRKLAAIMFTDMVGYTALMQDKEAKARELIQRHRELMKPLVEKHGGKILQYVGDGTFITFDSAIEAVNSAFEIQKELKSDPDVNIRIGIHVGDVVVDGEEVYGDGVNVASRLEPLAEPGGVCISGRIYDDIRNQEDIETEYLGKKELKNVNHPTKIYCLKGKGLTLSKPFVEEKKSPVTSREVAEKTLAKKLMPWSAGAVVVLLILFGLNWFGDSKQSQQAIAGENSIAVMYFENLTGDQSLNWIESGMVEMLTANLGKLEGLEVLSSQRLYDIMRQVSGKESSVRSIDRGTATEIARKAGVRTILLGSVLGTEGQLRLSTQLVEVATGKLVGSEVLEVGTDGSMFSLVDTLTLRIAGHLGVLKPERPVDVNVAYTLTNSFEALKLYVDGVQEINRSNWTEAIKNFEASVRIDTNFALAYHQLGTAQAWLGSMDAKKSYAKARAHADKLSERERFLIDLDMTKVLEGAKGKQDLEDFLARYPDEKYVWYQFGELLNHNYWPRASLDAFLKAIELDPYFLLAYIHPIDVYITTGQMDKARSLIDQAHAIDSLNSAIHFMEAYFDYTENNYQEAATKFRKVINLHGSESTNLFVFVSKINLALMEGNYAQAEIWTQETMKTAGLYRNYLKNNLAGLYALQGKYELAEKNVKDATELAPKSVFQAYEAGLYRLIRGRIKNARISAQRIFTLYEDEVNRYPEALILSNHLFFLAALKEGDQDEMQRTVLELKSLVDGNENEYDFLYYDALARFECRRGNDEMAMEHFDRAINTATYISNSGFIPFRYLILGGLMECLDFKGSYEKLIEVAEELPQAPIVPYFPAASTQSLWPQTLIRKARAYEKLGRSDEAIEAYEELLDLWKDADVGIPEHEDAINRLAALKQES